MIKIARQKLQLTQEEFAEKCGTSRYSISLAENNLAEIRISTLQKIIELGLGGRLEINIEL
jgi:transcriptional regulator with XRE-family HTH domain